MSRPTTFKVNGIVYWTINTFNADGVLEDADATPIVDIRKNGQVVLDVASSSKRAGTTGTYDYNYDPSGEAEGDCFTIQETATISSQAYVNTWSIEALASERGTDSAALQTTALSIVSDTSELQTNQNNWLTATTTISSNMRGTDNANTVVPNTIAPDNASISAILTDTADLQSNQGQWLTATGFNTVAPDNAGITSNGAAIAALNDLTASEVENAVWDATVSSHVVAGSYGLRSILALNSNRVIQITGSNHAAADVHEFQEDSLTSAATDASFVAEIQSGLALQTTSALILADTDELQANQSQWLTATTTVSSNMRGTDSALLAANTPTNFDIMIVDATGKITTSNPASGGGSAHTAQDVRDLILGGDKTTITMASNKVSNVALVDTTTNLTNGGGGGTAPTEAEMYTYFTSASRQDTFKADVSALALESTVQGISTDVAALDILLTTVVVVNQVALGVDIGNILADTNDLQGNQSQWLTATTTVASNMRGTDGANTVAPDNAATIYNYFTAGSNEDAFKAYTGNLATASSISSLNDFNPANETVITDAASRTASKADVSGLATSSSVSGVLSAVNSLNDFDPTLDTVINVTNVSSITSAPDRWSDFIIGSGVDLGKVTTSNPASGGGSAHTAQDVANLILAVPSSPLGNTVSGSIALVDTTTDLTNQVNAGPTLEQIVDGVWDESQVDHTTAGTFGYNLDAQVSTAGSGGAGLYQCTIRCQDNAGDALQGARVNVDGTTLTLTTGTSGEVTFNLDSGVYLLDVSPPANYDTPTSQVLTVTTSNPADTVFTLTSTLPPSGCTPPWIG